METTAKLPQEGRAMHTVEFRHICKYFPGVRALNDISFFAESGFIYAIVGENGAGKSTLLKILNGDYDMTSGELLLNGTPMHFRAPKDAIDAGISIIYQERQVVQHMTVAENVFLGNWITKKGVGVDFAEMNRQTQQVIDVLNLPFRPDVRVRELSIAHQQMVEIMKAYVRDTKVVAFDEPTASLSETEIEILFGIIRRMREEGKVVFYVSHRMAEIEQIADKAIVFKDGRMVDMVDRASVTNEDLIRMMVGRDLGNIFQNLERNDTPGEVALEVEGLCNSRAWNVSFSVRKGEVLGFAGLVGAGRTEVMRSVIGVDPMLRGVIKRNGKTVHIRSPRDAIQNGIVLCPEDRKEQGIIPRLSVGQNISASVLDKLRGKLRLLSRKREAAMVADAIERFQIKTPTSEKLIAELSGGNQQKTIVARCHETNPDVIILDEPTKGIDIGAKSEFYKLICQYARMGKAILLISSELPEIIGLSDRIIIMREGHITGEVTRREATEELILKYAMLDGGNA